MQPTQVRSNISTKIVGDLFLVLNNSAYISNITNTNNIMKIFIVVECNPDYVSVHPFKEEKDADTKVQELVEENGLEEGDDEEFINDDGYHVSIDVKELV